MLTSMMCVQTQGGGSKVWHFKLTVGKDGWTYGYWDNKPSKIEPDYLRQFFKELYVTAGGGMFYMYLSLGSAGVPKSSSFLVKVKDKNGNYLPAVEFTAVMFREDLGTGFWTANNNCNYKIYQRFESLEPVLGDIIMRYK